MYPNMNGDSSSDGTTATSGHPNLRNFVCSICFRIFPSGQALIGHQNAHLMEMSLMKATPNIFASVLNHPLPGVDEGDQQLFPVNDFGNPNLMFQQQVVIAQGDGSMTNYIPSGGYPIADMESFAYYPYEDEEDEEARRQRLTLNLLGDAKARDQVSEGEASEKSSGINIPDPEVDVELSLKIKDRVDLELRLGL